MTVDEQTIGSQIAVAVGMQFQWITQNGNRVAARIGAQQDRRVIPAAGTTLINAGVRFGGPALDAWLERLDLERNSEFHFKPAARITEQYHQLSRIINRRAADWEWEVHIRLNQLSKPFVQVWLLDQIARTTGRWIGYR